MRLIATRQGMTFTKLKAGVPWVISVTALSKFGTGLTESAAPVTPA